MDELRDFLMLLISGAVYITLFVIVFMDFLSYMKEWLIPYIARMTSMLA